MKNATIHDVASRAGVSIGTVSAVINRKDTVSRSTRRNVLEVITELNYRPRAAARRRLQASVEKSIGLVVKEIQNPYFGDIIIGAQDAAAEAGYNVLVSHSGRNYALEQQLVQLLVAKDVDGLIINPLLDANSDLSHLFELKRHNIPFVLIENVKGLQASMVDVDNVEAEKAAVEYLVGLGHKHIVHFSGPPYSMHSDERIEGVRRAFSARELVLHEQDVLVGGATLEEGYKTGLDYFRDNTAPPTAVACYNDLFAIGLMRAVLELGLRIPQDLSVVGYDDIEMASYAPVPLTTVRVPKKEMGRHAAEMLIRSVNAANGKDIEKMIIKADLVVRGSTAAPRAEG